MVLKGFEREFELTETEIDTYFLDLLSFRAISNEISIKFNIEHQSPQLLVFKEGKLIYHASHSDINAEKLKEIVALN